MACIRKDVLRWVREGIPFQRAKIHRHMRNRSNSIEVLEARFNHVYLDLITMPPVNEYRYCLPIIDRFTKWPQVIPLKKYNAGHSCSGILLRVDRVFRDATHHDNQPKPTVQGSNFDIFGEADGRCTN